MKQKKLLQYNFSKKRTLENLPYFIELQKRSFEEFLQKDIPLEKRKKVGIHGVLMDVFGMVGKCHISVETLPEKQSEREKAIKFLSKITNKDPKDIERSVFILPTIILEDVDEEECKKIKNQLKEYGVEVKIIPSGLSVESNDITVTLQYKDYKLLPPKYPLENNKEDYIYNFITNIGGKLVFPYNREACQFTGKSYDSRLIVEFRLIIERKNEEPKIIDEEVYLANIPLMTPNGSFIINGTERVVITQIHRSPGVFFEEEEEISQEGKPLYQASIIPYRGSWLEFIFDSENVLYVSIDKRKKFPVTYLLKAINISTQEIIDLFCYCEEISLEALEKELDSIEEKRKQDKKAGNSIFLAEDIIDKTTGEVLFEVLTVLDRDVNEGKKIIEKIRSIGENKIKIVRYSDTRNTAILKTLQKDDTTTNEDAIERIYRIMRLDTMFELKRGKNYIDMLFFNPRRYDLSEVGRLKINKKLNLIYEEIKQTKSDFAIFEKPKETTTILTVADIVATVKYLLKLNNNELILGKFKPEIDDIDHLGNRHIRPVGKQLEDVFRLGALESVRATKEMIVNILSKEKGIRNLTPRNVVNNMGIATSIKKFFATGELSQFLDNTNLLSDITSKRRISALGPGGLTRKHAGFEVRDIHSSHYGRLCPIETPEGANIGLITSLALYARVNEYGLIETPYIKVENRKLTSTIKYLTADEEEEYVIASIDALEDETTLKKGNILARVRGEVKYIDSSEVQFIDISPQQMLSVSASLIPFLEHDDANRALMGANMQRQAVPLLFPEAPLVATGIEENVARDSGGCILAKRAGEVVFVDASEIVILSEDGELDFYYLTKYQRSNQDTIVNYLPNVSKGQKVKKGEVIAGNLCTHNGQLALGKNVLVAFMSFEGYNFEDAILISERLVKEDVFTSITITEFETDARETKLGPEEITRDLPGEHITEEKLKNLDEEGIVNIGTEVKTGDILVGKVVPTSEQATTVEEKLLQAIFGKKIESGKAMPLEVPPGLTGKVIWRQVLVRTEKISKSKQKEILNTLKEKHKEIKRKIDEIKKYVSKHEDSKLVEKYYSEIWKAAEEIINSQKEKVKKGNPEDLPLTVLKSVKVYIASLRKIQVGDKLSGRHGNKGVVAKILPEEDMPFLPDGTPVDVVISPLSIPSRMNVGQLFEAMLGWSAKQLGIQYIVPPFDGPSEEEVKNEIRKAKEELKKRNVPDKYLPDESCKFTLYDGRTGEPFMEKVFVGNMYIMKLIHMVEDKIHARSTGPYSLVTKQPLGGKAHFGGQRFGEMEVWALEGYGAAYTLQEFLTVKSDDLEGRRRVYESIIKGEPITYIGVPESFKVLVKELQALALNIELLPKKAKLKHSQFSKESVIKSYKEGI